MNQILNDQKVLPPSHQVIAEKHDTLRNSSLDVFRAIAILLVMFTHLHLLQKDAVTGFFKYVRLLLVWGPKGGWIGVDLFFVLSGFLVSGLLFNEYKRKNRIDAKRFLIRRSFKIYPNFIFFITTAFIIERLLHLNYPVASYIKDLLFLNNYFGGRFVHTWSLDVEEFFYFSLAAYFLVAVRYRKVRGRFLAATYLFLVVIGIGGRWINNILYPAPDFNLHFQLTHFRLESLFFGTLLSYSYHFHYKDLSAFIKKYKMPLLACALPLLSIAFIVNRNEQHWISIIYLSVMPLCFGSLILIGLNSNNIFFKNRLLAFIGRNSYAIYLWHLPVNEWLAPKEFTSNFQWLQYFFSYFGLTFTLGILTTIMIEKPCLKFRDRLFPSKNASLISQSSNADSKLNQEFPLKENGCLVIAGTI